MRRFIALVVCAAALLAARVSPAQPGAATFPIRAHAHVNIEWWYFNAHLTTRNARHYAVIGAFFRLGNGLSPFDPAMAAPRAHYLIYGITDLDKKTHLSASLADQTMLGYLKLIAPVAAASVTKHNLISSPIQISDTPFQLEYGPGNSVVSTNPFNTILRIRVGGAKGASMNLLLRSRKPPMAVGGNGETGIAKPSDMRYYSLTRCSVTGTLDAGSGSQTVAGGYGWFDHQWGNSWVVDNDGWDWFGIQMGDGNDILCFQQRHLSSGKPFLPLATEMEKNGRERWTKEVQFTPLPGDNWTSPATGIRYPLAWKIVFPAWKKTVMIRAAVQDQEMRILGPGGAIWEGACTARSIGTGRGAQGGVAYMELVGYAKPGSNRLSRSRK